MRKYNRILLKLSGESLAGTKGIGIDFDKVLAICDEIKEVAKNTKIEIAIVVGGGNFGEVAQISRLIVVHQLI